MLNDVQRHREETHGVINISDYSGGQCLAESDLLGYLPKGLDHSPGLAEWNDDYNPKNGLHLFLVASALSCW